MKQRPVIKEFVISKHRYYELKHMCLQYNEWKDRLKCLEPSLYRPQFDERGNCRMEESKTEQLAIERAAISCKCDLIENTARRVGNVGGVDISEYIIKAVTNEGITYTYLNQIMNIPVSKNTFYDRRRKFFYELSKKWNENA